MTQNMTSGDGWKEFERQVIAGVPHAVDIAHHLACTNLSFPRSGALNDSPDLVHYAVVHSAYRKGVLRRYLLILERLRHHRLWHTIRSCRSVQQVLIDHFMVQWQCNNDECYELLAAWLDAHGDQVDEPSHSDRRIHLPVRNAA